MPQKSAEIRGLTAKFAKTRRATRLRGQTRQARVGLFLFFAEDSCLEHLPQNAVQDAAVAVILDFHGRIDAADGREFADVAVVGGCDDGHFLAAFQMLIEAANIESLAAGQLQRCGTCSPLELKRQYA